MYKLTWRIVWDGGRKEDYITIAATEEEHLINLLEYMECGDVYAIEYYKIYTAQ